MTIKKLILPAMISMFTIGCTSIAQDTSSENEGSLKEASYAIGVSIGENLKSQNLEDVDTDNLAKGINDVMAGTAEITAQEAQKIIQDFQMAQKSAKYQVNLDKSEKFLAENAKKDGVITTESGLQYKVIKEGTGASPTTSNRVTVHYSGTLVDGTPFDSSREVDPTKGKKGEPVTFGVTQVIKGWTEGLQLMKEGAIYEFYIHPDLGYGLNPRPGVIKPNDALVFNVELISIQ